jgi:chromate transporter
VKITSPDVTERPAPVSFVEALLYWLKLGFINFGGPAVEATRGDIKFTAPLTGITAAVVGVVINLAVFFAYHVLWPQDFDANFEWFSALIGAAAFIALFRYKQGIVTVIAACAAVGLVYSLLI